MNRLKGRKAHAATIQIIPEPSVFAFFGIGALLLAIRRIRK